MSKPKVALVGVASRLESGGQRATTLLSGTRRALENKGLEVVEASKPVWDEADALAIVDELKTATPDLLVIVHATWVCDTIQYLIIHNMDCPAVLWAVPYTETFSLACVQHFGSILQQNHIDYWYVYGLPEDGEVVEKVTLLARTAAIAVRLKKARIALIGPRQTWRVANSQDMVKEEWDFSRKFGATIVHVEMEELLETSSNCPNERADDVVEEMKRTCRVGTVKTDPQRLRRAGKIYVGLKEMFAKYTLTAASAECYPKFSGLVNLPSSWLADEGWVVDTEGDIGHTFLLSALFEMGERGPAALAEIGSIDHERKCLDLVHEGSSAHSLAGDNSKILVQDGGEGTSVGFPYPPRPLVTVTQLVGTERDYRILIGSGSTDDVSHEEWVKGGSKLMVRLLLADPMSVFNRMMTEGLDHHLLIKAGDVTAELKALAEMLQVKKVLL